MRRATLGNGNWLERRNDYDENDDHKTWDTVYDKLEYQIHSNEQAIEYCLVSHLPLPNYFKTCD